MYFLWNQRFLFDQGCADKLKTFLKDHLIYLLAAGMGIVLAGDDHDNDQSGFIWSTLSSEIMGMLCSLCLCCALKRIDDLKAWAFHISHWLLRVKVLKPDFSNLLSRGCWALRFQNLVSMKLFHFHLLFLYFYVVNSLMGALEFKSWTDLTRNEMFAWRLKISWRRNIYVVNSQNKLRCSWTELISALFILLDQPPYTIYVCLFTTSPERVPPTFVHIYTIDVNEAYLSAIWWLNTMI